VWEHDTNPAHKVYKKSNNGEQMSKASPLKGAMFEWFIKNILKNCGFTDVVPDDVVVYRRSSGLTMIHGLGQAHDADVLMTPPFQIPLYFPSRLLVECKCYSEKIGLPILRGVLGLREDINSFEIVTPKILEKRRNYRRKGTALYEYERFHYQVAFASFNEIRKTAIEYAMTHRIPIISFYQSTRYAFLRNAINAITDDFCNALEDNYKLLLAFFQGEELNLNFLEGTGDVKRFIDDSQTLFKHMFVGVLESGELILLYGADPNFVPKKLETNSMIHWSNDSSDWWFTLEEEGQEKRLYFELPKAMHTKLAEKAGESSEKAGESFKAMQREAITTKKHFFKKVSVYGRKNGELKFFVLNLDMGQIREARERLE